MSMNPTLLHKYVLDIGLVVVGALTFAAAPAFAGHENGNGGDVIACHGRSAYLLDYFEADVMRGIKFDVARPEAQAVLAMPFEDLKLHYTNAFVARVAKFDALLAAEFENRLANFFNEALIVELELTDVPDSFHLGVPAECQVVQAAIQREPIFPEDKRYVLSKHYWGKDPLPLCNSQTSICVPVTDDWKADLRATASQIQAGLMIHEVVFRRALELGHTNSIRTRYFHSYIMSQKYGELTADSWQQLRTLTGL